MNEQRVEKLNRYFDEQISLCGQRSKELSADDRMDEVAFEKIKGNVFEIFCTILSAAVKTSKGDNEATKDFFILKTEQIPSNWAAAYEKAKQHNDAVSMRIEQIKLETVDEIKKTFTKIWEEEE